VHSQGAGAGHSHGDGSRPEAYNHSVPLEKALLQFAPEDGIAVPVEVDRTAGVITIVGCLAMLLASILPWVDRAALSVSLTGTEIQDAGILIAILALISMGLAGAVLLRRPATAGLATLLIVLAVAQVGLAIWDGMAILHAISKADSHQILIRAIGTGAYAGVMGSVTTLAGTILAWARRRRE
jgi:hypothetical protein